MLGKECRCGQVGPMPAEQSIGLLAEPVFDRFKLTVTVHRRIALVEGASAGSAVSGSFPANCL